jgi:hypothetical protein
MYDEVFVNYLIIYAKSKDISFQFHKENEGEGTFNFLIAQGKSILTTGVKMDC